jgi:hypothetical protein
VSLFLSRLRYGTVTRWWRFFRKREIAMNKSAVISTRVPIYALHGRNACPSCGASQWIVGRVIAECACCGDTLPINNAVRPTPMVSVQDLAA